MGGHKSLERGWCAIKPNKSMLKSTMNMGLEHSFKRLSSYLDMNPLNFPSRCLYLYEPMRIIRWWLKSLEERKLKMAL